MTTPADHLQAAVDEHIAQFGVHVNYILDEENPYAYTIGLARRGHEELLMSGLEPHATWGILHQISHMVLEGGAVLKPGDRFRLAPNKVDLLILGVDDQRAHHLADWAWACNPDGIPVHVLQVVYPDPEGRLPWEEGHSPEWGEGQTIYGKRSDA